MDNSLQALCDTIKKILIQLKPQINPLSFIVVTGLNNQGKSAVLKQSKMEEAPVFSEQHAKVYFNQRGIIIEIGENWFTHSKTLLHSTLKQLNKCNPYLKITGLIFCIDVNHFLAEPSQFIEQKKLHIQLLERLGSNLGYPIELALLITKMDTLAGFSEFYQTEHATELAKPFGFSLECINEVAKKIAVYKEQFNQLIEIQGQQVINKIHPVRSTIKRSLIREFPLQLASLRAPIQGFVQNISPKFFNLHSIYFTSAEQGGVSIDRLNKKIQHEYALIVQDTFPQATNFRAYFVEGAFKTIQEQCTQSPQKSFSQKPLVTLAASIAGFSLLFLSYHYYKSAHLLDEVSNDLNAYDTLSVQGNQNTQALYHLSKAAMEIEHLPSNSVSLPTVHKLKIQLHSNTQHQLNQDFLPSLTSELEQVITNASDTPITRYKALKIYLMLGEKAHLSGREIQEWFENRWQQKELPDVAKKMALLKTILTSPMNKISVKQQVIHDARNYLNALPSSYLYYSLAKELFSTKKEKIAVEGFNLPIRELPIYYTKAGYKKVIKDIANISHQLQQEHWVLGRQDLNHLPDLLTQAYCYDYVAWWQNFMRKSQPLHYQTYQQGHHLTQLLHQSDAISKLLNLIQQETKPDLLEASSTFNELIANKFTDLNLISVSSMKELHSRIIELERFISTLSVINDGGKTAFTITRSRFVNDNSSDPISLIYNQARQLPEPLNNWANQIVSDTWSILISNSRQYINQQWDRNVYREFQNTIAKRYPFDATQHREISLTDFNRFFSTRGTLNKFTEQYLKPFLDISNAQWKPKVVNGFVFPITSDTLDEIIRANIITNMFFPDHNEQSKINFSLQKISLDPVIASLHLEIGSTRLIDTQSSDSFISFTWPQNNAKLALNSIEGNHYELAEEGTWAIFKLLEKVNVLVDEQDSSSLQILFEVNSNSGRYLLKTNNQVNPFTPGILNGFTLNSAIV